MKRSLLISSLLILTISSFAAHIAGGELQYEYLGPGAAGNDRYRITMRLFRECTSTGPRLESEVVHVGAYHNTTNTLANSVILQMVGGLQTIRIQDNIPCLVGSPDVCYQVAVYINEIELPRTPTGYTLAWARCCRANGLMNASGQLGATYITKIPGTNILGNQNNSSPSFVVKDTALVCGDYDFVLDFGANDPDGDILTYSFCDAYVGGTSQNQNAPPPQSLVLNSLPYGSSYSGAQPLGPGIKIDPATGIISGRAPASPGRYVVSVCVTEWRNGVAISEHRKDFILKIGDCNIIAAKLAPEYINCDNYDMTFENEANSSQVRTYSWDFGVANASNDTSNLARPSFTFPDTGTYRITLIINRNEDCSDTATSLVKIYPGFNPGFVVNGSCYLTPFQFMDTTKTAYGTVNSWRWDFGDATSNADTSRLQNPNYRFPSIGTRTAILTVKSSKGCSKTIDKIINVTDKPALTIPFRDTLICSIDSLQINAAGRGTFTWTPSYNIINANTANPTVFPKDTTTYYVELVEDACRTIDSVKVNVIKTLTVDVMADTVLCSSDSILLRVNSPALHYVWSPATDLSDPNIKSPYASPTTTRMYKVMANVGKCQIQDSINITVSPYPTVLAGRDTAICFGDRVQLKGSVNSISYDWSPTTAMVNASTLSPTIATTRSTYYILTGYGYEQCPKSKSDSVFITVIPPVKAFAGNDTAITVDQPLTLRATGGESYLWSPESYLSNATVQNPVVRLPGNIDSMRYTVRVSTAEGCYADDDIKITVFKTGPQIFVPDAFTPNRDGRNDVLYPVLVGMKQLDFFKVYNRYGQLMFSTSEIGKSWDGTFGGKDQPTGTFVYMAQAVNYKGERVFKKGTLLLIR